MFVTLHCCHLLYTVVDVAVHFVTLRELYQVVHNQSVTTIQGCRGAPSHQVPRATQGFYSRVLENSSHGRKNIWTEHKVPTWARGTNQLSGKG